MLPRFMCIPSGSRNISRSLLGSPQLLRGKESAHVSSKTYRRAYVTRPRGPPHGAGSAKKRRGAAAARETKAPHAVTADL